MKRIIGLVGKQGSGKGTVANILQEKYGAKLFRFSAILGDVLDRIAVEKTRDNLIALSEALRKTFGEDVLAYAIERDAATSDADLVVVDGIRRVEDLAALEPLPQFRLVKVEAPIKTRFQRSKARGEKTGESDMSWEEFLKVENEAPTEVTIPSVEARAGVAIENDGTREELETKVRDLMEKL